MPRLPLEERRDAWCPLCASHGKPAGDGYCEECRPLRVRYLAQLPRWRPMHQLRRAVHRMIGIEPGWGIVEVAVLGALLALVLLFVALGD
jgi:hypothetical protein